MTPKFGQGHPILKFLITVGCAALGHAACAQESATVLPKGITRTRFVSVFAFPVTHSYDNNGNKVEIMDPVNQTIPVATQAAANAQLMDLYTKLNNLEGGLGDQLFQTKLESKGRIDAQRYVTAYEYGLSDKLSLGIIIPVINYTAHATFTATNQDQIDSILNNKIAPMGPGGQPLADGLQQLKAGLPNQATFEKAIFTDKGYKVPNSSSGSGLGEVEAGVKYHVANYDHWSSTIQTGFRLPTASLKRDYTNLLSQASGDGQLDYALQNQNEWYPTQTITIGLSNRITWQFADHPLMPVGTVGQVGLTDLNNSNNWERVNRDLGEDLDTEVSLTKAMLGNRLKVYGAYQYWLHGQDSFSGTRGLNYAALQENTNAWGHYFQTGVTVSTIPSVIAKTAKVPMEMSLSYNTKFAGKNSADVSYTRFDFYLYF